ncbi:MAG: glycosyltransferase family 4 protein [Cyanobacteria bacterium J06623_7]
MQNLLVITYIPSPYQVELFNAIADSGKFELKVAYLQTSCDAPIAQQWSQPEIKHEHLILGDREANFKQLEQDLLVSNLVVFNYYRHPRLGQLMDRCLELNKAWCFWGERPGIKHSGFLGWLYRRWKLATLHESSAPIWGVGIWGVEQYRREFNIDRNYFDLPYFANLSRFTTEGNNINADDNSKRVFLYSGALIERKGVDLLAAAFTSLAEQFDQIELHFVGEGELRPRLEKQLADYSDRVKFHGFQPWDKLPHYYQQADFLCVPSRYDGWGMVVPEGLAAGLPVIGTDKTGAAIELIRDSHNGWLIDANSETCLREAMHQAIKLSPTELANYSQAAKARANDHSLAHGVQRFEQTAIATIQLFAPTTSQPTIQLQQLTINN